MAFSSLEWDPLECPLVGLPTGCTPIFHTDCDNPDLCHCQVNSLWSMSTATGCGASSRTWRRRTCRLKQEEVEKAENQGRRQWIHTGGSERVKEGEQTALHRAAVVGNSHIISALIEEGCALERQDKDGNTALHEVSWHGFSQCVKLLVKAGANVHAKNKAGNTALHLACQNGHTQSSKVLLLGGSRPDSKNQVGDTPLHMAAALNHKKTVRLLLEAGADVHIQNNASQTALDLARDQNNPEVALLLTKAPQVQSFMRGRSLRKRREKLKAEGRARSVPRDEMFSCNDSASAADDTKSSDPATLQQTGWTESNTRREKVRKQKKKPSLSEPLRQRETRHTEAIHRRKNKPQGASPYASIPPHSYKAYQLYTLYRGKDGKIMQAPLNGCRCDPLISKLENQLEATKEEMKNEIHTIEDMMNKKLGQLDRKNKHQIRALDKMTVERVSAEKSECLQRIEQWTMQQRLEAEKRQQTSLVTELKSWCLSKLQNMEVHLMGDSGTKLQRSSSLADNLNEADGASSTVLPAELGCRSQLPELSKEHGLPESCRPEPSKVESGSANHYFVVHVENSPDGEKDHKTIAPSQAAAPLSSVQVVRPKEHSGISADTQKKKQNLQKRDLVDTRDGQRQRHRASSLSPATERRCSSRNVDRGRDRMKHHEKHLRERTKSRGGAGIRTLEVFGDQASGPSFAQERDNMHAVEVTQYFFEAVSTQMERWYERKVQEARWQADQKAQADKAALIERIANLEEELRVMRTSRHDEY
ncbi:ankyrin repeat domain-containing protein 6b isoform X4 [Fundulus heteroclitus]|uniref:ankyrin repeat domain-containing protein 6b isoform X4 n=1 Tax=Fundulus heteroclitus TaxID=8078 RepID=UPI00165B886F|nr:ankyrin repeat domain-containing protein 6b isoform X4 [Fundulus heteroclitus]